MPFSVLGGPFFLRGARNRRWTRDKAARKQQLQFPRSEKTSHKSRASTMRWLWALLEAVCKLKQWPFHCWIHRTSGRQTPVQRPGILVHPMHPKSLTVSHVPSGKGKPWSLLIACRKRHQYGTSGDHNLNVVDPGLELSLRFGLQIRSVPYGNKRPRYYMIA